MPGLPFLAERSTSIALNFVPTSVWISADGDILARLGSKVLLLDRRRAHAKVLQRTEWLLHSRSVLQPSVPRRWSVPSRGYALGHLPQGRMLTSMPTDVLFKRLPALRWIQRALASGLLGHFRLNLRPDPLKLTRFHSQSPLRIPLRRWSACSSFSSLYLGPSLPCDVSFDPLSPVLPIFFCGLLGL